MEKIYIHFDEVNGMKEVGLDRLPPQEAETLRSFFSDEFAAGKRDAGVEVERFFGDGTLLVFWSHDQWTRGERCLLRRSRRGTFSYVAEEPLPQ